MLQDTEDPATSCQVLLDAASCPQLLSSAYRKKDLRLSARIIYAQVSRLMHFGFFANRAFTVPVSIFAAHA